MNAPGWGRRGLVAAATLGAWAESILTALPPPPGEPAALAIDAKTLRGSRRHPGVHLLATLSHRLGPTLWQQGVADNDE